MTTDGYFYLVALILFVFVVVVLYVYGRAPKLTFIEKPILGLLDLSDGAYASEVLADRATLSSLFYFVSDSTTWPPKCDVLFVYCQIEADGRIRGLEMGLRDLIRESGAPIVVVAAENTAEAYIAAAKSKEYGFANLMMIIYRKGDVFAKFFYNLFSAMKQGVSMPMAYVKLSSQMSGNDFPGLIFYIEAGQIAFRDP